MLGTEVEFSTCVSQALEIAYSGLFSVSASRWLKTATSRVVIPSLARISFSCSDGFCANMFPECTALLPSGASWAVLRLVEPMGRYGLGKRKAPTTEPLTRDGG